jgi:hypothetical protein
MTIISAAMIPEGVASTAGNAAIGTGNTLNGSVWFGRMIKSFFADYLFPGIKQVWNFFLSVPGIGVLAFTGLSTIGTILLAFSNSRSMQGATHKIGRFITRFFACFSFVLAGASLATGVLLGIV